MMQQKFNAKEYTKDRIHSLKKVQYYFILKYLQLIRILVSYKKRSRFFHFPFLLNIILFISLFQPLSFCSKAVELRH